MIQKGVTILEILIVLAIMGILASIILYSFSDFRKNELLSGEVERLLALIQDARTRTLSSIGDTSYGIHFETASTTLFLGTLYTAGNPSNETITLSTGVVIKTISLQGGGSDILFRRLSGETEQYGSIVLALSSATETTRTIIIERSGIAGAEN